MPDAALAPGSTIGILGGGQLGRMLALAAARLGLKVHVYSDGSDNPAFDVAHRHSHGRFDDLTALAAFARTVDVITYEFENVPVGAAEAVALHVPVRPGPRALEVSQDRVVEKRFIAGLGLPVGEFAEVAGADQLGEALGRMNAPAILKTRRFGYDGKGQVLLRPGDSSEAAWSEIGRVPAILERRLAFDAELSVLVVRGLDGDTRFYDPPRNEHRNGILSRSVVPSGLPAAHLARARAIAARIAEALGYVGVLAVEMFHLPGNAAEPILVNEIAPRVHNSGHWTMDACVCSQFENHIRAVAGWPLGSTERHANAEMVNLIGAEAHGWREIAAEPGAALHLYGKGEARSGRKMGHVNRLRPRGA